MPKDAPLTTAQRLENHEKKCDVRMGVIHGKIDSLARLVYIGFGVIVTLQVLLMTATVLAAAYVQKGG